jgi:hypothetical protein
MEKEELYAHTKVMSAVSGMKKKEFSRGKFQ